MLKKFICLALASFMLVACDPGGGVAVSTPGGGIAGTGDGGSTTGGGTDYEKLEAYAKRVVGEEVNINDLITYSANEYQVSNTNIAQVDADGNIVFLQEGVVTVTITPDETSSKPVHSKSVAFSESLPSDTTATSFEFVVKRRDFTFSNWVGEIDTLITYTAEAFGLDFIRTTNAVCDLDEYELCDNAANDLITETEIQDSVTTLNRPGFYGYKFGESEATHSLLSSERFEVRSGEAKVVFNDRIYLIGGYTTGDVMTAREYKNDIWYTTDGGEWVEVVENASFTPRSGHQVIVYDDKLWLMGGSQGGTYYNDVWTSEDGIEWTEVSQTNTFGIRTSFELFVLNDEFYIAGGYTTSGNPVYDLWRSTNGDNWSQINASFLTEPNNAPVVVTGDAPTQKAFLLGDSVLSSTDGNTWTEELDAPPFAALDNREAAILNGTIWLFTYTYDSSFGNVSRIYTSDDALTWSGPSGGIYVGNLVAREAEPIPFLDQIFIVGGRAEVLEYTDEVWSTTDAKVWTEHALGGFYGPRYSHGMASFNGKLYSTGGISSQNFGIETPYSSDVWSSQDGLNWEQVASDAAYFDRGGHELVAFDDRMCLVGGYGRRAWATGGADGLILRVLFEIIGVMGDGWCTFDGVTWHELVPSGDRSDADGFYFDEREGFAAVNFNDQLWLIGGNFNSTYYADVWYTDSPRNWVERLDLGTYGAYFADYDEATSSAAFGPRTGHAVTVHNGEMYLSAGKDSSGFYLDDLWKSRDGITWTEVNSDIADMDKRAYHQMVSFDNKLWIIGGRANFHETLVDEDTTVYEANDIWVSADNGVTWEEVTDDASFEQRQNFEAIVHNGYIYIAGGTGGDGYVSVQGKDSILNDVWRSDDGINWRAGFSKDITMEH